MTTRLYLPTGTASPVTSSLTPTGWSAPTEGILNRYLNRAPRATTINGLTATETTTSVTNIAVHRCVSDRLVGQTISGTFTAVFRCLESAATADLSLQVALYLISEDGTTLQSTLYGGHTSALTATVGALGEELGTTSSTRIMPSTALSSQTCVTGDRLMAMVGYRAHNTSATSFNIVMRLGDNAASDFALTSGLTTDLNPWIELSGNLRFVAPPPPPRMVAVGRSTNW